MTGEIPSDALCAVEGCGHRYDRHKIDLATQSTHCELCVLNAGHGYTVFPVHGFEPRALCGGALNGSAEREAYERAMRGE